MFKTFWNDMIVRVVCRGALIVAAVAVICGCDMDEGTMKYSSLPQEAKTFVETHFPGIGAGLCKWERDDGHKTYEVQLLDGTELEFDSSGEWIEVDCKFGTLPKGILPAAITEDLATRYPLVSCVQSRAPDRRIRGLRVRAAALRSVGPLLYGSRRIRPCFAGLMIGAAVSDRVFADNVANLHVRTGRCRPEQAEWYLGESLGCPGDIFIKDYQIGRKIL